MAKKKTKRKIVRKNSTVRSRTTRKSTSKKSASTKQPRTNRVLAIVALIINLIIPGLGSLVGRRYTQGSLQLILTIIGAIIWTYNDYGAIIITISIVWALVTSIQLIRSS